MSIIDLQVQNFPAHPPGEQIQHAGVISRRRGMGNLPGKAALSCRLWSSAGENGEGRLGSGCVLTLWSARNTEGFDGGVGEAGG